MLRKAGIFLAGGGVVGGLLYFGAQRALQSAQQMISDQMQVSVVERPPSPCTRAFYLCRRSPGAILRTASSCVAFPRPSLPASPFSPGSVSAPRSRVLLCFHPLLHYYGLGSKENPTHHSSFPVTLKAVQQSMARQSQIDGALSHVENMWGENVLTYLPMLLKNMDTVLDIKAQGRLVKALITRKDTATPQQKMAAFDEVLSLGLTRVLTGAYAVALITSLVGVHVSVQSKLMVQDGSEQATTAVPGAAPLAVTDTEAGEAGTITETVKSAEVLLADPASTAAEVEEVASKVRRRPALPVTFPAQPPRAALILPIAFVRARVPQTSAMLSSFT